MRSAVARSRGFLADGRDDGARSVARCPSMEPTERDSQRPFRVAIVGGGASGALVATHLLRAGRAGIEIVVIEPRDVRSARASRTRRATRGTGSTCR